MRVISMIYFLFIKFLHETLGFKIWCLENSSSSAKITRLLPPLFANQIDFYISQNMANWGKLFKVTVSFSVSFSYGIHVSQTYDLPDMMRSVQAVGGWIAGQKSIVPKLKKKDKKQDDEDDDR